MGERVGRPVSPRTIRAFTYAVTPGVLLALGGFLAAFSLIRIFPDLINRLVHDLFSLAVLLLMGCGAAIALRALFHLGRCTSGLGPVRAFFVAAAAPGLACVAMMSALICTMVSW